MRPLDLLAFAVGALTKRRLRTLLCLLGVSIGIAAVVVLTALGEGARRYVVDQFSSVGTNLLIVTPGKTETAGAIPHLTGSPKDLTLEDAQALQREVREIHRLVPLVLGNESVSAAPRSRHVPVVGTSSEFMEVRRLSLSEGQFLPVGESTRGDAIVVLGRKLADEIFPGVSPLGRVLRIGQWRMRVIGVFASRGTQLGLNIDEVAVVPVAVGMRMFNRSSLTRILVEVAAHAEIDSAKERTLAVLRKRHREEDVTCITQESILASLSSILRTLTMVLGGIGAISLFVAGVGIMNVMLVSVSERTPEVGLLRALGAMRPQVLGVFLVEAALISTAGGLLGLALGEGTVFLARALFPNFPASIPHWASVLSLLVSVAAGIVFGLIPAIKATRLDPARVLSKR